MTISKVASKPYKETSQSNLKKHNILIDTDIGDDIDDALALAIAICSPEFELLGVTTVFGNTPKRACLAAHLLETFGQENIPVAAGQPMPLLLRHRPSGVPQAAILDPRAYQPVLSSFSAPELIIQKATAQHGDMTLICLGPLTNVATALIIEPRLFLAISNIVMVGGTTRFPWPEWNIRSDAQAAKIVLASGIPITLLGWNVTMQCQLRESDIEKLHYQQSPRTRLLCQLIAVWQRHRPRWQPRLPFLHDPLAIVALCAPELLTFEVMTARVFTRSWFKGFMLPRVIDGPLILGATGVKAEEARAWIMRRLLYSAM